jgi:hypothetical protein
VEILVVGELTWQRLLTLLAGEIGRSRHIDVMAALALAAVPVVEEIGDDGAESVHPNSGSDRRVGGDLPSLVGLRFWWCDQVGDDAECRWKRHDEQPFARRNVDVNARIGRQRVGRQAHSIGSEDELH